MKTPWYLLTIGVLTLAAPAGAAETKNAVDTKHPAETKAEEPAQSDADASKEEADAREPHVELPTPGENWIRVDAPNTGDADTVTMMLHPRGHGRLLVRKLHAQSARDDTVAWLRGSTRDLAVIDREVESGGQDREEFVFEGWQGRKPVAGIAGVYVVGDDAYAVVATCDRNFYEKHQRDFDRVLAEFRAKD